ICLVFFKHKFTFIPGIAGLILIVTALTIPDLLNPVRRIWDKMGETLGIINTAIILSLMFFLIITPIAFLLRLFKKTTIEMKVQNHLISYWQPSEQPEKGSYKRQF
ncbi:SxtJ family membrane protein, partial [Mucilaginibacter sp.]|uniref:SxtJ family membrane protein n=1 Tax=Mucilaginibacter sp. TaxID=1882438 RepID=UPI002ED645A0